MTDTTAKIRKGFIIKDFRDAGTEANFSKGDTVELTAGEFTNYEAAGLVRAPDADAKASPKTTA